MTSIVSMSEFKERRNAARFAQDMLISRVTGMHAMPATPETDADPRNPIKTPCDDGCLARVANARSGLVPHRDAPVLLPVSCETSAE